MKTRHIFKKLVGFTVMMALLGCGASSGLLGPTPTPEPTATPAPLAKSGHWKGDPNVSFDVSADGEVNNFRIVIAGDCILEILRPVAINADGSMSIGEVDSDGQPVNDGIVGTFGTATTIQGTIANPFICGSYKYGMSADMAEWSAVWVGP
ncbi:MAG: hypothetical protein HYZ26_05115 [Chloroflexi bacterium]|nr:hypothetical protein [Chloroflexota bacterium]